MEVYNHKIKSSLIYGKICQLLLELWPFFSTSCFAKCLRLGEVGPGRGHLCHTDTFLFFFFFFFSKYILICITSFVYDYCRRSLWEPMHSFFLWIRVNNYRVATLFRGQWKIRIFVLLT